LFFFEPFPVLRPLSHAYRFAVPLQLCVAVMGAWGVVAVAARIKQSSSRVAWGVGIAVLIELVFVSPAPFPVPTSSVAVPAAYGAILRAGAILDLPASLQVLARSRYNLFQVGHGRPIPYGLNDPTPPLLQSNRLARSAVDLERTSVDTVAPVLPALDLALGEEALVRMGFAAVVLHLADLPAVMRERIWLHLNLTLGEGERIGDEVIWILGDRG
jgi:hypothetical protein